MIFLIPLLIFIGIIFGIDYVYFSDEDSKIEKIEKKPEQKDINEYIKRYTK